MSNPNTDRDKRVRQIREQDGSLTFEQLKRAALIAQSRGIDEELAQELVYLRDRLTPLNELATKVHHWEPSGNGKCVICSKLKLWQLHIDETINITSANEAIEAFCDKWGWIPEPAMLLDLGEKFNDAVTRMRDLCLAKVEELRKDWQIEADARRDPDNPLDYKGSYGLASGAVDACDDIITALESLTLEQGEQEK